MMATSIVVFGDTLLDRDIEGSAERLTPDAPVPAVDVSSERSRPGGAGLAAALAARDGHDVTLVTALAGDAGGEELRTLLLEAGVDLLDVGRSGSTEEKVRVRTPGPAGRSLLRLDRREGRSGPPGSLNDSGVGLLRDAPVVLVSDYGRGITAHPQIRSAIEQRSRPTVWDPHPNGAAPTRGVRLATPNLREAARSANVDVDGSLGAFTRAAQELLRRWSARGVAVTLGERGALYADDGDVPLVVPPPFRTAGDPCGAGDRFATAAASLLAGGALPSEAVCGAVAAATEFVARGGASSLSDDAEARGDRDDDPWRLVARVRARGGTVVTTSGCFDLLHAGHVANLRAARQLGDCLVVCLNADASVRRLKGKGRPIVPLEDRREVLLALDCVDAVVPFEEDVPLGILARLHPDVFAKGGDYTAQTLPEADLVRLWGGQAVVLPYLDGRSTSQLVDLASGSKTLRSA
ncbi:MAG: PfkB family carbohydrate kinase [Actinomycetota bacterium]